MNENLERGIALLRKGLQSHPGDLGSWLKLANALIAAQREGEVVDVFCQLVSALPDRPQMHYDLLSGLVERGPHFASMRRAFEGTARESGAAAGAFYGLGLIRQMGGDLEDARRGFEQALQKDPKMAAMHHNIAVIFLTEGKPEQAVAEGEAAIRQEPGMAEPHYLLGTIHMDQGRLRDALHYFEAFVSMAQTPDMAQYASSASFSVAMLKEKLGG